MFNSQNTSVPIIEFQGEDALLVKLDETLDPEYGTPISQTSNETSIKAIFEEVESEQVWNELGKDQRVFDCLAYVSNNVSAEINDRIKRFPNTSSEKTYEVVGKDEFSVYTGLLLVNL